MNSVTIIILFIVCVLVQAFAPAWRKKRPTILLSDEELITFFSREGVQDVSLSLYGLVEEIEKKTGNTVDASELEARLEHLVHETKLRKDKVLTKPFVISSFDEGEDASLIILYSLVKA